MKRTSVLFMVFVIVQVFFSFETMGQRDERQRISQEALAKSEARHEEVLRIAKQRALQITGVDSNGRIFGLQNFSSEGRPEYYITCNAHAAWQTGTDIVNAIVGGGLNAQIGMWDGGGVRTTHDEFGGRVTQMDSPGSLHYHPTHVAGTLVAEGIDAQARGMAYEANLYAYDWNNDNAEMGLAASAWLKLSNHSYSYIRGWYYGDLRDVGYDEWFWLGDVDISETEDYRFGFYCYASREIDSLAFVYPEYLIVTSAGNDRNDDWNGAHYYWDNSSNDWVASTAARNPDGGADGYDCIPNGRQTAKNTLTVGAVSDYMTMTDFTSWGPADDGRVKPDIMGHGHTLYSTWDTADDAYDVLSGTSMSSPNVCGSLALLAKDYTVGTGGLFMRSATLKGLAIHTAADMWPVGPDYRFGWGVLDLEDAYLLLDEDLDYPDRGLIEELTIHQAETIELHYVPTGTGDAWATICWTDPEGIPSDPAVDPNWVVLVNDLDMEIEQGTTTHQAWILDRLNPGDPATTGDNYRDNVEQVYIDDPGEEMFVIRITHKGILFQGPQDFSLFVSGMRRGRDWHVYEDGSGDAPDITTAVALASDYDHIFVHPGTYYEHDINVNKELMLKGVGGPESTIIDAQDLGRCIYLPGWTDSIIVKGFTLQNGLIGGTWPYGGGIYCRNPRVLIEDCIIKNNEAEDGGGIYLYEASPHIKDCAVMYNEASDRGGGIWGLDSEALIEDCLICYNTAGLYGGGVYLMGTSNPDLENCTISHNAAPDYGSGLYLATSSASIINNTIVTFGEGAAGIHGHPNADGVTMACCDVYGNEGGDYGGSIPDQTGSNGNISQEPRFCDVGIDGFGLGSDSPCAPANNSCGVLIGAKEVTCTTKSTWYVTADGLGDAPTIQAAIDSCLTGDTVLVALGTFTGTGNRDITYRGKEILVRSEYGAAGTIIDCESAPGGHHTGFNIYEGEDTTSVLDGFTITHASRGGIWLHGGTLKIANCVFSDNDAIDAEWGGGLRGGAVVESCTFYSNNTAYGAIRVDSTAIFIRDCLIMGNTSANVGGGVYARYSMVDMEDSRISTNNAASNGGGICAVACDLRFDGLLIEDNDAGLFGGGVYFYGTGGYVCRLELLSSTVADNSAPGGGAGLYVDSDASYLDFNHSIIAFNRDSEGYYRIGTPLSDYFACNDVYGNEGGDYGGGYPDQTGINDNISEDPLFCDLAGDDYHLYDASPCAPANSPCGQLIGKFGVDCTAKADLIIADVELDKDNPEVGEQIQATIKIKNIGIIKAYDFYIDYYEDLSSSPGLGQVGEQRYHVDSLAAGDSLTWITADIVGTTFEEWSSWVQVDTDNSVSEIDDSMNVSGPHDIYWEIPVMEGWPVAGGGDFHSSPAIARLDDNPVTKEVVIGCDDGKLYAFTADGDTVAGWPVDLGDPVTSSPAVGDIRGDYHNEVVVGCGAYLYAYDYQGQLLWSYGPSQTVTSTPALADLDDDGKLEVIFSRVSMAGDVQLCVLTGKGVNYSGSWPLVLAGTGVTSAAVGDVDDDGHVEIAVIANGFTKPTDNSRVYLLTESGANYSMNWPVQIDTVVTASPVLGDITHDSDLEVITGGLDGKVYAINLTGAVWPSPPQVPGAIERSLALGQADKEPYQEIIVSSRFWNEPVPPFGNWVGVVTVLDDDGTIMSSWPNSAGSWVVGGSMPAPVTMHNRMLAGSPGGDVYGWEADADVADGFARDVIGGIFASLALGDLDGDGSYDLVAAADLVVCFDLSSSTAYGTSKAAYWPMFRNGRTRCGCYCRQVVSDAGDTENVIPVVTALRSIYPNPFNPMTRISFDVGSRARVNIAVYDASGRRVCVLEDRVMNAGSHEVVWHGRTDSGAVAASGIYFCRLVSEGIAQTKKMVLLR